MGPERSGPPIDLEETLQQRREVHGWLWSELVREGLSLPLRVEVSGTERARIDEPGPNSLPVRVGLVKSVRRMVSLADLAGKPLPAAAARRDFGAVQATDDGGYAFSAALEVPGATGVRLHFTDFWLPPGGELYLLTGDGQVFGPYVGRGPLGDGEFWSHTVMGESLVLQLRQFGPVSAGDLEDTWFEIADLGFVGPKFLGARSDTEAGLCSYNAVCVENADCVNEPAVNVARDAVAHMQWISGPYLYMCSGGLIADRDTSTPPIPYFLSANHCISRARDAKSLECFFQYTAVCGTSSCPDVFYVRSTYPQELRTLGASIQATNRTGDYTLFRLAQPAPAGSAFLGWSDAPVATAGGTGLYRISHTSGAPQAYSAHVVDASAPTCVGWPRGSWIYSRDVAGATEGGSSGSPVVNASGEVVGQLSGACGYNLNDVCDETSNATVDGAFASYFSQVEPFLNATPCQPESEVCDDGSDNDCDGLVDCADPDCDNDPACASACGVRGDPCTTGSDCCSGVCGRKLTCK